MVGTLWKLNSHHISPRLFMFEDEKFHSFSNKKVPYES